MTKSRVPELNPMHRCSGCGFEHFFIPNLKAGEDNFTPIEITVVADGVVTFTTDKMPAISSRVPIVGMIWGIPSRPEFVCKALMVLN